MYCVKVAIAALCFVVVCGNKCQNCNSSECGPNEERVKGHPRRDRFCRPHVTPRDVLTRRRSCVCRRGYVRNSWDECVTVKQCTRCKCRPQKDWNLCASRCPPRCNEPISQACHGKCAPGCECPPGWVLDFKDTRRCVKVQRCSPRCPAHSKYQQCTSTCAPRCAKSAAARKCTTRCYTGNCVCEQGYYELLRSGQKSCVTKEECPRLVRPAMTMTIRNEIDYIGGGARAPAVLFPPATPGISGQASTGVSTTTGLLRLRQGSAGHGLELVGAGREGATVAGTTANQPYPVLTVTRGTPSVNTAVHGSAGTATIVSTPPSLPSTFTSLQGASLPGGVGLNAAGTGLGTATPITATVPPSPSVLPNPLAQPSVGGGTVPSAGNGPRQDGTYFPGGIGYNPSMQGTRPGAVAAVTGMAPPSLGGLPFHQLVPSLGSEPSRLGVAPLQQPGAFLPGTPTIPTAVGIGGLGLGYPPFGAGLDVGEEGPLPDTLKIPPSILPIPPSV